MYVKLLAQYETLNKASVPVGLPRKNWVLSAIAKCVTEKYNFFLLLLRGDSAHSGTEIERPIFQIQFAA